MIVLHYENILNRNHSHLMRIEVMILYAKLHV